MSLLPEMVVKDGPLQSVKLIEYCISATQICGIFFNVTGGYFDIVDGLKDFKLLKEYVGIIDRLSISAAAGIFESSPGVPTTHQRLMVAANSGFDANLMEALQLVDNSGFIPSYKSKNYTADGAKRDLIAIADLVGAPAEEKDVTAAEIAGTLQNRSAVAFNTAVMDLAFLILNSIAFYGYLLGVLSYFFPANLVDRGSVFGRLLTHVMLGLTNDDAEYFGFLAGDVAWTVEPLLAIACPTILAYFAPVERKTTNKKTD
eukprot:gene23176-29370_t